MKILVLDGGGVFGRIQSHIISEADCIDKFDAFAGTSIGAPQVLCAALGRPASPDFFDKWMGTIFHTSFLRKINIFKSEYPDTGLNLALKNLFDSALFGDAKKPVFITAADVCQKNLKVFSSVNFEDAALPAWEVCRCATAAETYFPPWKGFADGGIFANNPSQIALSAAVRVLGAKIEDIEIFSIGTGTYCSGGSYPSGRLTTAAWLIRAMLNGAADKMHDYFVRSMPIKRYVRINFVCDDSWKMDDPRSMYLAERNWAEDICKAIKAMKDF